MGSFIGPHTAETQRRADYTAELCRGERGMPADVAGAMCAEAVIEGRDPLPDALVFDACRRDDRWETYRTLTESGRWAQRGDGCGYDKTVGAP